MNSLKDQTLHFAPQNNQKDLRYWWAFNFHRTHLRHRSLECGFCGVLILFSSIVSLIIKTDYSVPNSSSLHNAIISWANARSVFMVVLGGFFLGQLLFLAPTHILIAGLYAPVGWLRHADGKWIQQVRPIIILRSILQYILK